MTHAFAPEASTAVRSARCIEVLRKIWIQQYSVDPSATERHVTQRPSEQLPPSEQRIRSPYDLDARYARHNDKEWVGYRTHISETCDAEAPIHLITQVETVLAPTQDVEVTEQIHSNLAQ